MAYKIGVISHAGNVRKKNEDSVLIRYRRTKQTEILLAAVADGMGGLACGERASRCAALLLNRWWENGKGLEAAELSSVRDELGFLVEQIHQSILQEAAERHIVMGTTLSLFFLRNRSYFILQAGDSRIYLIHGKRFFQLTEDQTWCREQVRAGKMNTIELEHHPNRHVLSNAIGAKEEFYLESSSGRLKHGEKILLCTDGYYSYLEQKELAGWGKPPQRRLELSKQRILKERAEDNLSAILIQT